MLEGTSIVLAGETLLDPVYLAYVAVLLNAVKANATLNKVDFMSLQGLNGGHRAIEDPGVSSIDVDIKYQHSVVEENDRYLRARITPDVALNSIKGSLALVYELLDRKILDLYEFSDQYIDGICYLQTGDPDRADPNGSYETFYGWKSIIADVLRGEEEHEYWFKKFKMPHSAQLTPHDYQDFLATQIWTRVGCVGRCARTHEPYITYNPWTIQWISRSAIGRLSGAPIEQRFPLLLDTLAKNANEISVREYTELIDSNAFSAMILEGLDAKRADSEQADAESREDWLLLVLNLVSGAIPGVGQTVTLLSHLYQRTRSGEK